MRSGKVPPEEAENLILKSEYSIIFLCLRVAKLFQKTKHIGFTNHTEPLPEQWRHKKSASPGHCRTKRLLQLMTLGV